MSVAFLLLAGLTLHGQPGFREELCVRADRRTLTGWWRGDLTLSQARASGMVVEGRREWVRAFPGWFERYLFAGVSPARRSISAGLRTTRPSVAGARPRLARPHAVRSRGASSPAPAVRAIPPRPA